MPREYWIRCWIAMVLDLRLVKCWIVGIKMAAAFMCLLRKILNHNRS